tara:strand:- start:969 stop:1391 length:423 start_codon:yes stop_codon:yes gene_type:complete
MSLSTVHKLEKAVILLLNKFDGWELTHTGSGSSFYDAEGYTPKGRKCVIEMKFRKKYYEDKMLEVDKYNRLMALPEDIVKIYFVSDPEGTYFFWLDGIDKLKSVEKYCPRTTMWNNSKKKKEVYLLTEDLASYVYKPDSM